MGPVGVGALPGVIPHGVGVQDGDMVPVILRPPEVTDHIMPIIVREPIVLLLLPPGGRRTLARVESSTDAPLDRLPVIIVPAMANRVSQLGRRLIQSMLETDAVTILRSRAPEPKKLEPQAETIAVALLQSRPRVPLEILPFPLRKHPLPTRRRG